MDFRLFYRGPLKSNGDANHKHLIRRHFNSQLKQLWTQPPLSNFTEDYNLPDNNNNDHRFRKTLKDFHVVNVISADLHMTAELDIIFLRPGAPGDLILQGGDIDNLIKTLLDSLRMPHFASEMPNETEFKDYEQPLYCLMQDDSLVTRLSVTTDRLLDDQANDGEVVLIIKVSAGFAHANFTPYVLK